jgi:hypothetical protein
VVWARWNCSASTSSVNSYGDMGRVKKRKATQMSPPNPSLSQNILRTVFGVLLCVGYVYVVFFFFLMFRTVLWPSYFAH